MLRRTWRLFSVRGVPVEAHWSCLLLPFLAGLRLPSALANLLLAPADFLADAAQRQLFAQELREALFVLALVAIFFLSLLVHELGHTLRAQALGIPVRRVLLLPVGGLTLLGRLPEAPGEEVRLALAGPAMNLALVALGGGLLWLLLGRSELPPRLFLRQVLASPFSAAYLGLVLTLMNVYLGLVNLLPAFPLDGGRILRGLLAHFVPRLAATRAVAFLSVSAGIGLLVLALFNVERLSVLGALSVAAMGPVALIAARHELLSERSRSVLQDIPVRAAVRQPTWTVAPTDPISLHLLSAFLLRPVLPVVVEQRLVGLLRREDVQASAHRGPGGTVAHLMRTHFAYVRADDSLWRAQQLLLSAGAQPVPVLEGERLLGMLSPADIREARWNPPPLPAAAPPIFISGGKPVL